jgi:ATP-dependent DNA helicase RecQ
VFVLIDTSEIRDKITQELSKSDLTSRDLESILQIESSEILKALKQLLEHNKISINSKNQFILI